LDNQYRLATCCRRLADLHCVCGRTTQARDLYRRAFQHLEVLAQRNPTVRGYQADLAGLYMNVGQSECEQGSGDAPKFFQRAREILAALVAQYPQVATYQRDLAVTLRAIASLALAAGQRSSAIEQLREAQKHLRQLHDKDPDNAEYRDLLQQTEEYLEPLGKPPGAHESDGGDSQSPETPDRECV
jgi:tetratricopeptide (TPR) repeat protein